jgi:DNA polymerase III subunit gamma/tau
VVLSNEDGGPTLDAQGDRAAADRLATAAEHPLVRAVLATFPGATIAAVRDAATDAYGLTPTAAPPMDAAPMAPPDALPADPDDQDDPEDP